MTMALHDKMGDSNVHRLGRRWSLGNVSLTVISVGLLILGWSGAARAEFGVAGFDGSVVADPAQCALPGGSCSFTQAGGHPYSATTAITLNTRTDAIYGQFWPEEPVKDVVVEIPPGLIANPTVVPRCTLEQLMGTNANPKPICAPAAQVGVVSTIFPYCLGSIFCGLPRSSTEPLYNMVPPPGVPAEFAFVTFGVVVTFDAEVRSPAYGANIRVADASEGLPVIGSSVTLWGVPADRSHDGERRCPGSGIDGCRAGVLPKGFLSMPTSCSGPEKTTVRVDSWFHPGDFKTAEFVSHRTVAEGGAPQGTTGCDQVPFDPSFTAQPDDGVSPGPSGWSFDLRIPQEHIDDPDGIVQSHLKRASVTLPVGVRVSPSAADGLQGCSSSEIRLKSDVDPVCPDASKVGELSIETPLLEDPLEGAVYLAKPHDNPSNSLLGLYLVAQGDGVTVKLAGSASPDPKTGQLTATFDDNPQLPFSHLHLHFFGGPRASLSNPPRCGTYSTTAVLTSWSGKMVETSDSFTTSHDGHGAPCPGSHFKPAFSAGTSSAAGQTPDGGSFSSFVMNLSRTDDDEEFGAIKSVHLPDGLLAKVAGIPLCPAARVAAGTCGEGSRIGSVTTTAGPGPNPFAITNGRVYLGGPYKGAPFSLSIVVPAVAGPFDLGNVVVRAALKIDPTTAKLSVDADPLPTVLQGIPLQVRLISVLIDRPKFIVNPTSCDPKRIRAVVASTAGTVAHLSSHFQADNCARLPLSPRLTFTVGSKGHTRQGVSTPLKATLTQPPGQAGLKAVAVTLPDTLNALLPVVNRACTRAAFDAGRCGKRSRAGFATAVTPLLEKPLRGAAYFVQLPPGQKGLPNLIVALRGQVDFNLISKVKIPGGKLLATRFGAIPDVPVRKFTLSLLAGANGPIGTAANLCTPRSKRQVAQITYRGQNGKLYETNQRLRIRGCTKHRGQHEGR